MLPEDLFAELVDDQKTSDHPWSAPARQWEMLIVFNQLCEMYTLTASGDVLIDRDQGVLTPASPQEREVAHIHGARRHPQLRYLMPKRPPAAQTCPTCDGAGEVLSRDGRRVFCGPPCNSRGWVAADPGASGPIG